jgi:hypothetical protein
MLEYVFHVEASRRLKKSSLASADPGQGMEYINN